MDSRKVRDRIRKSGIFFYQVAQNLEISEMTLRRWLRVPEVSPERVKKIDQAIARLQEVRRQEAYVPLS